MKLKITQENWAGFTGNFGGIDFVDGVSVNEVTPFIAQRLSAVIGIETVDGKNPSVTQYLVDSKRSLNADDAAASEGMNTTGDKVVEVIHGKDGKPYTRAELETIATAKGINGLRSIADGHNIKGTKIVELIEKILKAGVVNPASIEKVADDSTVETGGADGVGEIAASVAKAAPVKVKVSAPVIKQFAATPNGSDLLVNRDATPPQE